MGKKDRQPEVANAQRPDAWEQFRVLVESVDQGRRVTELVDHKIRYALVLIGVVNAAVIYLATRSDFRSGAPQWLLLGLGLLVVLYIIAISVFSGMPSRRGVPEGSPWHSAHSSSRENRKLPGYYSGKESSSGIWTPIARSGAESRWTN